MSFDKKLEHSIRPVLWLRQLAVINWQKLKIADLEDTIKNETYKEFTKYQQLEAKYKKVIDENKNLKKLLRKRKKEEGK